MCTTLMLKYWYGCPFGENIKYWLKRENCNYWSLSKEKYLSLCSLFHLQILKSLNSTIYSLKKKRQKSTHSNKCNLLLLSLSCLFFRLARLFNITSLTELLISLLFANHYFILFGKSLWQFYCRLKAELILALVYLDYLFKGYRCSPLMGTLKRNKIKYNLSLI